MSLVLWTNWGGDADQAVRGDLKCLIVPTQEVEGFRDQFQFPAISGDESGRHSQIRRGVTRAFDGIAAYPREPVVLVVTILIWVSANRRIHRPATAHGDHSGSLPMVEQATQQWLTAAKRFGLGNPGKDESLSLVGNAIAFFCAGRIRVLHQCRTACYKCVLSVVNSMRVGVGETKIETTGHLTVNGECCTWYTLEASLSKTPMEPSCGIGRASGLMQGG